MKRAVVILCAAAILVAAGVLLSASSLQVPSGTWIAVGPMNSAHSGASAVLLQDGRILVAGGNDTNGPSATTEFFGANGSFSMAMPMNVARSGHAAIVLQDGRVLVAGGTISGGASTNSAEIYDPVANTWTNVVGGMVEARSAATLAILGDGRVLVAGGQNGTAISSTIEIFDPSLEVFTPAGVMSSPRTQHTMTVLADGRVLIVGGNNGTAPVDSTDIFDPVAGAVSAGPSLSVARFGHSATTLLNGQVVVIGGNNGNTNAAQMDVTPAEVVDFTAATPAFTPLASNLATPREGHLAFLLPNNNNVLIVGGTSAGATVASAELFTLRELPQGVWTYGFGSTGSMATARSNTTGAPNQVSTPSSVTQRNGVLLVAGGNDANGNPLNASEAYGFPTVQTDASDYPPGTPVNITGSGFQPNETVTIQLVESPLIDTHGPYTVQADTNGNISDSSFVTDQHDLMVRFYLTATGGTSGFQAQNTFTDSKFLTLTFSGNGSGSVTSTGAPSPEFSCTDTAGAHSGTCSASLNNNDVVNFTAATNSGSAITTWATTGLTINSGCTSGSTTCSVTMGTTAATVTVTMVVAGPAAKLAFLQQPITTKVGALITPSIMVQVEDASGNRVNTSSALINMAIGTNPGGGSLLGSTGVSAVNGVATFNCSISASGIGYTLSATSSGLTGAISNTFDITQAPAFTSTNSTSFTVGTAASFTVTATGVPAPTFSETGALSSGITFTSGGVLSGTASTSGNYTITITASNGVSPNATQIFTLTVGQAPAFTSANNTAFTVSAAGTFTVTATGFPAPTFSETGTLPTGATLTAAGVLSGTPTVAGSYPITITASNGILPNATQSFTLTVNKAAPTITFGTAPTPTYLGGNFTVSATTTNTDSSALTYSQVSGPCALVSGATFSSSGAGTCVVKASGAATANFNAASATQNVTIAQATPTVTFGAAPTPTYLGGNFTVSATTTNTDSTTLTYTRVSGPCALVSGAMFSSSGAGTCSVQASGAATTNFLAASNTQSLTIAKAISTFSGLTASQSIPYGQASISLSGGVAAGSGSVEASSTDTVTVKINGVTSTPATNFNGASGTFGPISFNTSSLSVLGSPYIITYTYSGNANLASATNTSTMLTVNPKAASVTPNAASKTYGSADPAFTGTLSGFLAADNVAATFSRAAGETVASGPYTISSTLSPTAVLSNYNITYNTANFTINPLAATWTTNANSKTYGSAEPTPLTTGGGSGFLTADGVTATYSRVAGETVLGGPYQITATLSPSSVLSNYTITNTGANFTITAKAASVTPNAAGKVYGSADPAFTGTLAGFLAGDSVTATYSRTAGEAVVGSPYTISAILNPTAELGNYSITYNTANFTITQATSSVTVTCPPSPQTYTGSAQTPCTASYSTSDAMNGMLTVIYTNNTDAGTAGASATYAGDSNHAGSSGLSSFTISQASSSTTVSSSENPSNYGDSTTYTATVSSGAGTPSSGTVQFEIDGTNDGLPASVSGGTASVSTSSLLPGQHTIAAVYSGSTDFTGSTSAFFTQTVTNALKSISVTPGTATIFLGQTQQFTANGTFADGTSAILPTGGVWAVGNSLTNAVRAPMAAAGNNGILYFFGGQDGGGAENFVQTYNLATSVWGAGANMPTARYQGTAVAPGDGKIYVIGGWNSSLPTSVVEAYDPSTNTWASKASMVGHLSACSVSGAINGKIYVVTGCNGTSGYFGLLDVYDPVANSWSSLPSAPNAHGAGAGGVINGKLYVVGGYNSSGSAPTSTLDVYDPQGNTWSSMASMPAPLGELSGGFANGKLYIAGGLDGRGNPQSSVYIYDPASDSWSTGPTLSQNRRDIGVATLDGLLYAGGGYTASNSNLLEILDTDNVTWKSDNAPFATVDPTSGQATGVTPGTANIFATSTMFPTATGSAALTVQNAHTTTTLTSSENPSTYGDSVTFMASVAPQQSGLSTPIGTVQFVIDGTNFGSAVPLTGGTSTSGSTSTLTVAGSPHSIEADYTPPSGSVYLGSTGTLMQAVNKAGTTTTVTSNPTATYGDVSVTLSASIVANSPSTATVSEGTVTFTVKQGSNTISSTVTSRTVSGGRATASFPLSGVSAGSYSIQATYNPAASNPNFNSSSAATPGTLTVNTKSVTATLTAQNRTYDGTNIEPDANMSCTLTGVLSGDTTNVTCTATSGAFDGSYVGVHTVTATATINGTAASNYTLGAVGTPLNSTTAMASASITTKAITATLTAQNRTYDGTNTEPDANMSCTLTGVLSSDTTNVTCKATSGTFDGSNVSAHTVTATVTISGSVASNYTLGAAGTTLSSTSAMASASITTKAITATLTAQNRTYDGTNSEPDANMSCTLTGVLSSDTTNVTCTPTIGTFDGSNVGAHTVTATVAIGGSAASNYTLGAAGTILSSTAAMASASITTRAITATLTAQNRTYDRTNSEPNQNMSCTLNGVLSGDTSYVNCAATSGTFNSSQVANATTVTATVTISGTAAGNYTLGAAGTTLSSTSATASANITPATPLVTVMGGTFTFDGLQHPASAAATGVGGVNVSGSFVFTYTPPGSAMVPINANTNPYSVSAAFSSADSNYTGSLGAGSITINPAATLTLVSSSLNPSNYGDPVTFTAVVTNTSTGATPTGMLALTVDSSPVPATVSSSGNMLTAIYSTAALTVTGSPHSVVATYTNSDGNFSGSGGSLSGEQTVNQATTGATISSSASSTVLGQAVTFTATIADTSSGSTGTPTGIVNFYDGAALIGSATLNQAAESDQSSFTTALLSDPVYHSISAVYKGDSNFSASPSSSAITQTVTARPTSTAVALLPATVAVGISSTATITVTDTAATGPSGTPGSFGPVLGSLNIPRTGQAAVLLPNGTVLLIGGKDSSDNVLFNMEIYYPSTSTFMSESGKFAQPKTPTNCFPTTCTGASATLLNDGTILIVGGSRDGTPAGAFAGAAIYNSVANSFTPLPGLATARFNHAATLLPNGNVLIAGGEDSTGTALSSTEIYSPSTQLFTPGPGPLSVARAGLTSTLLPNGKILMAGGSGLKTAELYDPTTGSSVPTSGNMSVDRTNHTATLMLDGNVLMAGGTSSGPSVNTIEIYNTAVGTFTSVASTLTTARSGQTATMLDDGHVLMLGGTDATTPTPLVLGSAETYTPSFDPLGTVPVSSSDVSDLISGNCTLTLTGTGATTCTSSVTPPHVDTNPHVISGAYSADNVHSASVGSKNLTVNPGQPVIAWGNPADITYGTALSSTQLNATVSYLGSTLTGTFAYTPADGIVLNAGSGQTLSVTFTPTAAADYLTATANVLINVNKATPVVTWSTPADITYGTALSGTQLNATFTWTVGGIPVAVTGTPTYAPVEGTVLGAGQHQALAVSFAPTDTADYNAPAVTTVYINVNKATPVVTWSTPVDITYGTALSATQLNATFSWVVNGVTQPVVGTASYTPAAGVVLHAGSAQPVAVSFAPTDTTDYNAPAVTTVYINVNKATPVVTWSTPADITYGTALNGTQLNATFTWTVGGIPGAVGGTPTYTPAATTVLGAGQHQALAVSFAPTDTADYNTPAVTTVYINVNKATTTAGVVSLLNPSTYGQPVTFKATISPQIAGVPTGTVTFMDGATALASGVMLSGGQASFTTSGLLAATHSITATYTSGDGNFLPSAASTAVSQAVNRSNTTTADAILPVSVIFGSGGNLTLSATVSANSPSTATVGEGNVTFTITNSSSAVVATLTSNAVTSGKASRTYPVNSLTFGSYQISASFAQTANFNASSIASASETVNAASTSLTVATPPAVQYSDLATLIATVSPATLDGQTVSGTVAFTVNGNIYTAPVNSAGVATLTTPQIFFKPSPYGISAVFTSTNPNFLGSSGTSTLTVTQEDARVNYAGNLFVGIPQTSTSGPITLVATISDITAVPSDPAYDPYPGDIRNATVTFVNRDASDTMLCTAPVLLVNSSDTKTGSVTCSFTGNVGSGGSTQYTVGIVVGGYYTRNSTYDNAVVTISQVGPGMITGGGYAVMQNSGGTIAGDPGSHNNFGFNVSYQKGSGSKPHGNINTIVRQTHNGAQHVYQIKGNSMTTLAVYQLTGTTWAAGCNGATSTSPCKAQFNGQANIEDITNEAQPVGVAGGLSMQFNMTDYGSPGKSDTIGITVWNGSGGIWFSTNWVGTPPATVEELLGGGNLVVH